jgi:hypothetical protein
MNSAKTSITDKNGKIIGSVVHNPISAFCGDIKAVARYSDEAAQWMLKNQPIGKVLLPVSKDHSGEWVVNMTITGKDWATYQETVAKA